MGDFDDGRELGLWGDDGIPYWMDEVDNTAAIRELQQELQTLKDSTPKDKGNFTTLEGLLVLVAAIFGYGVAGLVLYIIFILYHEPKAMAYKDHMNKIFIVKEKIERYAQT